MENLKMIIGGFVMFSIFLCCVYATVTVACEAINKHLRITTQSNLNLVVEKQDVRSILGQ